MTWSTDWSTPVAAADDAKLEAWTPADVAALADHALTAEAGTGDDAVEEKTVCIDAEAIAEAAYGEGYGDGLREGERAAGARIASALKALESAVTAWETGAAERASTAEDNMRALAVGVARHIIGRELRTDAQGIADLIRSAIAQFPANEPIRIRLNPADLSAISTATDGMVRVATGREVEWQADVDLSGGDCVIEGERRVVDGRLDRALERVYVALTNG